MDHRDEFSKWIATVENALISTRAPALDKEVPQTNECGCGSWNCPTCFPQQDNDPLSALDGMPSAASAPCPTCGHCEEPAQPAQPVDACPACGHSHSDGEELVQIGMDPAGMDPMSYRMGGLGEEGLDDEYDELEEEPMEMVQRSASEKGRNGGVKLGSIVQKFVPADSAGKESPLTHGGDNLGEMRDEDEETGQLAFGQRDWDAESEERPYDGYLAYRAKGGTLPRHQWEFDQDQGLEEGPDDADFDGPEELEMGSPLSKRDFNGAMEQMDPEEAMEMISEIKYMQNKGLSMAPKDFSEDEMAAMNPSQLKKTLDQVRGNVSEEDEMMQDAGGDAATGGTLGAAAGGGGGGGQYAPGTAPTMPESIHHDSLDVERMQIEHLMNKYHLSYQEALETLHYDDDLDHDAEFQEYGWYNKQGNPTMENIDKDIAAMLTSLKKYDKLNESVLGMTTTKMSRPVVAETSQQRGTADTEKTAQDAFAAKRAQKRRDDDEAWAKSKGKSPVAETEKKPDFLDFDKDQDKKEPMTKALKDKEKKEEVSEGADQETLNWMKRFANLGNMKGYGR